MADPRFLAFGDHDRITTSYDVINFCSITLLASKLASRVLRLFGQWLVAKRDSGVPKFLQLRISTVKRKEKENRTVTGQLIKINKSINQQKNYIFSISSESLLATNRWPKFPRTLGATSAHAQ